MILSRSDNHRRSAAAECVALSIGGHCRGDETFGAQKMKTKCTCTSAWGGRAAKLRTHSEQGSKTASLTEVRVSNVVLLHSIMVSSDSLLELSLAQSVEDLDSQYNTYAGEFIADGQWTQYSDAPTPAFYDDSQGVERSFRPSSATPSVPCAKRLTFVPLTNWDRDATYNEVPPTYIHYSIECKVMVNKKVIFKETEPDIVLDPASYWRLLLQPRVEELLKKNIIPPRSVRANNTNVVISVTDRKERDLNKRFDETNIVWSVIEKQLIAWSDLFERGKKL